MFLSASLNTLLILLISTDVFVRIPFENKTNSNEMPGRVGPWVLRVAHTTGVLGLQSYIMNRPPLIRQNTLLGYVIMAFRIQIASTDLIA